MSLVITIVLILISPLTTSRNYEFETNFSANHGNSSFHRNNFYWGKPRRPQIYKQLHGEIFHAIWKFWKDFNFGGRENKNPRIEADVTFHPMRRRILDRLFHEEVKHPYLLTVWKVTQTKAYFLGDTHFHLWIRKLLFACNLLYVISTYQSCCFIIWISI